MLAQSGYSVCLSMCSQPLGSQTAASFYMEILHFDEVNYKRILSRSSISEIFLVQQLEMHSVSNNSISSGSQAIYLTDCKEIYEQTHHLGSH